MKGPSQPEQPNDGCLTLIDRFLDFTLVGIPRWQTNWLSRTPSWYQRWVLANSERERHYLYLPTILRTCLGMFVLLAALLAAALLAIRQAARRT